MNHVKVPASNVKVYAAKYVNFKGVDLSTDPTQISGSRSPYAPNLISDSGGFPEKRPGWRTLYSLDAPINGIYRGVIDGTEHIVIHAGSKLYHWDGENEPTAFEGSFHNGKGDSFCLENKIWILTGAEYLVYDGETLKSVEETAYIPATTIAKKPADPGSGEPYENANLLQPKRMNKFIGDASTKVYQLDATGLDSSAVKVEMDGAEVTSGFTVDAAAGKVTFTTAPGKPKVDGQDNVFITFSKTVEGYADRIKKCTVSALYGVGNNDRAFLTGNPDYPATDWWCWFKDPSYFPDQNYADIGSQETRIMGYSKIGSYLAIHKEDNSQDSTIYLRSSKLVSEATETAVEKVAFPTQQGVSGIGAVAVKSFANLIDEPLFLARTGIYALTSNTITAERTVQNRSYFVDAALTREKNLENAAAVQWNGYYLLCVNSNCYVLDGKQDRSYKAQSNGSYVYECYYWENIPAACFLEREGELFFGTADGRFCKFNTDVEGMARYNDDGDAISCCWATKADDDGDFMTRKSMIKRGSGVMIKPYSRSSAKIAVRTERDFGTEIRNTTMDIFDWEDIDFSRFTFNANDAPQVVPFNSRVKKYVTLQILVKNDAVNEGFGVFGIIKRYTKGNYVKR